MVLYDADCGFCIRSARLLRRLDREGQLDIMPLQHAAETMADVPDLDALLEAMHVRDAAGRWSTGGAAWVRISQEIALLRPLGFLGRLPIIRRLVEPTYALVADNRHRLSRLLGHDGCHIDQGKP